MECLPPAHGFAHVWWVLRFSEQIRERVYICLWCKKFGTTRRITKFYWRECLTRTHEINEARLHGLSLCICSHSIVSHTSQSCVSCAGSPYPVGHLFCPDLGRDP